MGIQLRELSLMLPLLNEIGKENLNRKKILTLGVQDCYFTYDECLEFLRKNHYHCVEIDQSEILFTTGFKWADNDLNYKRFIHQITLFRMLGFDQNNIYSLDASNYEKCNYVVDLNLPVEKYLWNQMDIVFDLGTFEHIFSLSNAFDNIIKICKIGGYIVHHSPIDFFNHGYYNFNAELFDDIYEINEFTRNESCYIISPNLDERKRKSYYYKICSSDLIFSLQPNYISFYFGIFVKTKEQSFKIPQQGYYKDKWSLTILNTKSKSVNLIKICFLFILKKSPFIYIYNLVVRKKIFKKAKLFVV